jgi:hypothetical protein
MTDPRYGAPDVTDEPAASGTSPKGLSEQAPQSPSEHTATQGPSEHTATPEHDGAGTPDAGKDGPSSGRDPHATTELPRTGWGSTSTARSDAASNAEWGDGSGNESGNDSDSASGDRSGARSATQSTRSVWSADQTQNFPAYRPQSYPSYPPTSSQTSELPAVGAGGATTAAAYGGSGAGPASAIPGAVGGTAGNADRPRRRAGAGLAGALGLIGLAAAAYGAFALPVQKLGPRRSPYFVTLRELATHKLGSTQANAHSVSLAGGHAATLWWRYGLAGALGVLALLLLVQIWVPVLRRVAGVLLFLGGLAAIAGFAIAVHQTNDYRSYVGGIQGTHRVPISQLSYGIWVPVAGCAVAAVGGLIAAVQSTRR